jgi:hypothetical protein
MDNKPANLPKTIFAYGVASLRGMTLKAGFISKIIWLKRGQSILGLWLYGKTTI